MLLNLRLCSGSRPQLLAGGLIQSQRRHFWMWLNFVFNRVDHSRVREVGPDRAAAEWVLRLGGTVKFRDLEFWSSDYNRLPSEPRERMRLEAIDASGVSITDNGLEHLNGLEGLRTLNLSGCNYLRDAGLAYLASVKDSLHHLDLSSCVSITHAGLPSLYVLKQLRTLDLTNTPGIRHRDQAIPKMQAALSHCDIRS